MPIRWRAPPSSSGAGIVDQSGVSMLLLMVVRSIENSGTVPRGTLLMSEVRRGHVSVGVSSHLFSVACPQSQLSA